MEETFQEYIKKRSQWVRGVLYAVAAAFFGLSLLSFSATDASFNRASSNEVENFFGAAGAYVADPLLQLFGVSSVLLVVAFLVWAGRCLFQQNLRFVIIRFVALIGVLLCLSAIVSYLPTFELWPFYVGLGGLFGDVMREHMVPFIGDYGLLFLTGVFVLSGVMFVLGVTFDEIRRGCVAVYTALKFVKWVVFLIVLAIINLTRKRFKKQLIEAGFESDDETSDVTEKPHEPIVEVQKKTVTKTPKARQASLKLNPDEFELPDLGLLSLPDAKKKKDGLSESALSQNARLLEGVLKDFGVKGEIIKVRPGPVVTLYELEPSPGTKSSRVVGLADDIARSMSAVSVRIAVVPGRNVIGIELPNTERETVFLRELFETAEYRDKRINLAIALGKDIGGETVITDLARMPHLLVAGTTGSGKSVAINTMILSILYNMSPDECKFIMIDPKMLELSVYEGIPHLLAPVVTEPSKAVVALKWAVKEMENRYRLMSDVGVRNVAGYNKKVEEAQKTGQKHTKKIQTGFNPETGEPIMETKEFEMKKLPFIVVIVDEMADLMLTAGKDIEGSIQRLAQMARAAGIHIIMATQRPSVDVITGVIKANFPTRISFQVTSRVDSRTILGEQGAEQLLGMGDMLYMAGGGRTVRVHGAFVDDKEVNDVVAYLKQQGEPAYVEDVTKDEEEGMAGMAGGDGEEASLYDQAVAIVLRDQKVSTSYIQRQLRIGYNRAANIIEEMEREGVISSPNHAGKREILVGS